MTLEELGERMTQRELSLQLAYSRWERKEYDKARGK